MVIRLNKNRDIEIILIRSFQEFYTQTGTYESTVAKSIAMHCIHAKEIGINLFLQSRFYRQFHVSNIPFPVELVLLRRDLTSQQ